MKLHGEILKFGAKTLHIVSDSPDLLKYDKFGSNLISQFMEIYRVKMVDVRHGFISEGRLIKCSFEQIDCDQPQNYIGIVGHEKMADRRDKFIHCFVGKGESRISAV